MGLPRAPYSGTNPTYLVVVNDLGEFYNRTIAAFESYSSGSTADYLYDCFDSTGTKDVSPSSLSDVPNGQYTLRFFEDTSGVSSPDLDNDASTEFWRTQGVITSGNWKSLLESVQSDTDDIQTTQASIGAKLGGFLGTGLSNVKDFFLGLVGKSSPKPSEFPADYNPTTDSLEALGEGGGGGGSTTTTISTGIFRS